MKLLTKTFCTLVLALSFAACGKNPIGEAPDAKVTLTRTIVYPNRNNETLVKTYTEVPGLESIASITDGKLRLFLNVPPGTTGNVAEGLALDLDATTASQALIREFSFSNMVNKILYARYSYTKVISENKSWTSITESLVPGVFGGTVRITAFDPVHRTLSGSISITASNLMYDPLQENIATPPDPANRCNLTITATFAHVRIR